MLLNTSKLIALCLSPAPAGLHVCSPDLEFTARGSSLAQSADVVQGEPLHTLPAQCPACPASCHHSTCFVTPQAGLSGAPAKPQSQVRPPGPHLGDRDMPFRERRMWRRTEDVLVGPGEAEGQAGGLPGGFPHDRAFKWILWGVSHSWMGHCFKKMAIMQPFIYLLREIFKMTAYTLYPPSSLVCTTD